MLASISASAETPQSENPVWLQEPDGAAFADNYPSQAVQQSVEGYATIECTVLLDTTVACAVIDESPQSWGFGDAALAIARTFRVQPARIDGVPVENGRIRRTLRFVVPEVDWREDIPPEFRAMADQLAPPELPTWDLAPTSSAVSAATPEGVRAPGRGVLSCRVAVDRRLTCEPLMEIPRGSGLAAAAMTLAPQFRIAQGNDEFVAKYVNEPFVLPISFNSPPELTPVNRDYAGLGPIVMPPMPIPRHALPERVTAAGIHGSVMLLCTVQADYSADCVIESETPRGTGVGNIVLEAARNLPDIPPSGGLIPGDQIRGAWEF